MELTMKTRYILNWVHKLRQMHHDGLLGGDTMPEDQNPGLLKDSADNYHYFTLPMSLNYQRNSYALWAGAKQSYLDTETRGAFFPKIVVTMGNDELKRLLTKYKVALQPTKQTEIWKRICNTICELFDGDLRNLFKTTKGNIPVLLELVQKAHKAGFPYISGQKICNYWLYVMDNYTDASLTGREALNIAPDTHVIQATLKLGLIGLDDMNSPNLQQIVSTVWKEVLDGTGILPIDIHTPLWLWSRSGFF